MPGLTARKAILRTIVRKSSASSEQPIAPAESLIAVIVIASPPVAGILMAPPPGPVKQIAEFTYFVTFSVRCLLFRSGPIAEVCGKPST